MIGRVEVATDPSPRVLGVSVALRAMLSLQAAGAERVAITGAGAASVLREARADSRVRIELDAVAPSSADVCSVADGVVVDARAIRSIVERRAAIRDAQGVLLAGFESGAAAPPAGVVVAALDGASVGAATRALLASLRKPQDGWVSRAINRRISLAITRVLAPTGLRPNVLSVGILAVGLAGGWLASTGSYAGLALGGVCFQAQSVLDGCDGELSRLSFRGSRLGEWLDTVGDDATNYAFFAGAAIGLRSVAFGGALPLLFGAVGLAAGLLASGIEYAYLIRIGSGDLLKYPLGFGNDPDASASPGPIARVLGAIRPAFKRDFFALLTMCAALAGRTTTLVMLGLFAGGALATLSAVLASEVRRARR